MSGPATFVQTDEAMAAAMQERYRQEFLQRQARKNRASSRVAPTDNNNNNDDEEQRRKRQEEADAELARRLAMQEESGTSRPSSSSGSRTARSAAGDADAGLTEDERLARRLHDQELARRYGGVTEQPPVPARGTPTPFVASLYGSGLHDDDDAAAARRIAQELDDEDMARRYGQYERQAAARRQAMLVEAAMERKRRRRKCLVVPLCCVVIAVTIVALFMTGVLDRKKIPGLDDIDWIIDDPFDGDVNITKPANAYAWENKGNGLRLQLLNALDESYQSVYATAFRNWDNGDPDALELTSRRVEYDPSCSVVEGKLKVCNDDYGATRWRGLNEILHTRRTIYASTAKMNDFYLRDGPDGQRLYTTCHEIGHGFGLPHWDENFYNKDLGNCMDYTDSPEDSATPDRSNFEFLAEVYGTLNRRRLRGSDQASKSVPVPAAEPLPKWLLDEYQIARDELENFLANDEASRGGWRRLESLSSEGRLESHQRDLGGGYTLQVHLLLA